MVWRQDAQSLESGAGLERLFGGAGVGDRRGLRGVQHWVGDAGVDLVTFDALRMYGFASELRVGSANGRDGIVLEHGQARADLPHGGRLRAGAERDLWTRWKRPYGARGRFQLGRRARLEEIACRLFEK